MCEYLLGDLQANCPRLRAVASNGSIVYQTNHTVNQGTGTEWTIDLVVGERQDRTSLPGLPIPRADPSKIWLAVDAKAIMTEHGKARRNRQRDLNSMADILHRIEPSPIIGGYVIINMATEFQSPLRDDITHHRNIVRIVEETIPLMNEILMDEKRGHPGLDAAAVTVIDYTNKPGSQCKVISDPPAPDRSSPLHYDNFIRVLCEQLTVRFLQES